MYQVELFHHCKSNAEAINVTIVVRMPSYTDFKGADWLRNVGRTPPSQKILPYSVEFFFYSLEKTEHVKFNMTIKFAESDRYFKNARIYFTALPIEHFYKKHNRSGDIERDVAIFTPKVLTELIQLIVQGQILLFDR